jgi:ribosome-binding protein aMBF1 (putative translation factor)
MGLRIPNTELDRRAREVAIAPVEREKTRADVPAEGSRPAKVERNGVLIPNAGRGLIIPNARRKTPLVAEKIQKSFGDRVRAARQERGISQEGLALVCDLDRTFIGSVAQHKPLQHL